MKKLDWLIGKWEGIQGQGIYHEEWDKISEGEITGTACTIRNGEISNIEKLKIYSNEDEVFYIAEVEHNANPVSFALTCSDATTLIFENPLHDFPKKITYEKKGNALIATIEGTLNGKFKKIDFELKQIS